jgi:hypothetical protein
MPITEMQSRDGQGLVCQVTDRLQTLADLYLACQAFF